jgi:dethiobiotin synthetase
VTTHPPPEGRLTAVRSLFAGWAPSGRSLPEPEALPPAPDSADDPAPAAADPAPAAADPGPAAADPGPAAAEPAQAAADPGPAAAEPAQAAVGPAPAAVDLEPASAGPDPASDGPASASEGPEPVPEGSEPVRDDVAPAAESREPGTAADPAEDAADPAEDVADARRPVSARVVPRPAETGEWRGIVLITGTDTDVGKTIVTSAIAASAQAAGLRVAVVKPGQTGTADGGPTDADLVNRLAGPHTVRTLASYPDPLAPLAAARVAALPPLELYAVVDAVRAEAESHDLVLVEGAGGLLVPMGVRPSGDPWTFADLAVTLGVGTIVVTRAGLGTLNHTALTLEALARRGVPAGVVLGAWPAEPELVHWANLSELVPHLVGALPDGAGAMDPGVFRRSAPGWLTPALYGVVDNWRTWAEEVS